jgi:hypothetical protein
VAKLEVVGPAIWCRIITTSAVLVALAAPPGQAVADAEKTLERPAKFVEKTAKRSAKFVEKTAKRAGKFVEKTATKTGNAVKRAVE